MCVADLSACASVGMCARVRLPCCPPTAPALPPPSSPSSACASPQVAALEDTPDFPACCVQVAREILKSRKKERKKEREREKDRASERAICVESLG